LHILTEEQEYESSAPEKQPDKRGGFMNKDVENEMEDELRPEYDFAQMKGGVRGRYVELYRLGTNLDEDGAQVFTTPESVNKALRALIESMPRSVDGETA
jgi:hypothetical protein